MEEIENALKRAQKLTDGLLELVEQTRGDIPDELDSYQDLEEVFESLGNLDGAAEHLTEIRSELRDALVTRVRRAVDQR
jgi:hypothetical protein